jgi:hypothetical protein
MANTKNLSREMRKGVKRAQRRVLKSLYSGLTAKDRKKFNGAEEKVGLKAFVAAQESGE